MPTLEERVAYLEGKFEDQSTSFTGLQESIQSMERRLDGKIDRLDAKVERLDAKVERQFVWLIGIQVTVLLAVIGTLLSAYHR